MNRNLKKYLKKLELLKIMINLENLFYEKKEMEVTMIDFCLNQKKCNEKTSLSKSE